MRSRLPKSKRPKPPWNICPARHAARRSIGCERPVAVVRVPAAAPAQSVRGPPGAPPAQTRAPSTEA
eukprot:2750785-Prymnesium_polylepis.2